MGSPGRQWELSIVQIPDPSLGLNQFSFGVSSFPTYQKGLMRTGVRHERSCKRKCFMTYINLGGPQSVSIRGSRKLSLEPHLALLEATGRSPAVTFLLAHLSVGRSWHSVPVACWAKPCCSPTKKCLGLIFLVKKMGKLRPSERGLLAQDPPQVSVDRTGSSGWGI